MNIQELKPHEGELIEFKYRGKYRPFTLTVVFDEDYGKIVRNGLTYGARKGDFRMEYAYGSEKNREWSGFWSNKIENVRLIKPKQ